MKDLRVTFLFAICLPLILLSIHVFTQNQISYYFISNEEEKQVISALVTLVDQELHAAEYEAAFSAKGGSASGGNTYSLSIGVCFYQLVIRDPETSLPDGKAGSGQTIIQTKKLFLLNNIFSIFI